MKAAAITLMMLASILLVIVLLSIGACAKGVSDAKNDDCRDGSSALYDC